jgi:ribonuclease D
LPTVKAEIAGPPPVPRWKVRNPAAAERLGKSREALAALAHKVNVPVENLIAPDLVRRLCWSGAGSAQDVRDLLVEGGARPWQVELVGPVLATTTVI